MQRPVQKVAAGPPPISWRAAVGFAVFCIAGDSFRDLPNLLLLLLLVLLLLLLLLLVQHLLLLPLSAGVYIHHCKRKKESF